MLFLHIWLRFICSYTRAKAYRFIVLRPSNREKFVYSIISPFTFAVSQLVVKLAGQVFRCCFLWCHFTKAKSAGKDKEKGSDEALLREIWNCFQFTSLHSIIGPENSLSSPFQSIRWNTKTQRNSAICVFPPLSSVRGFYRSWLTRCDISFVRIGADGLSAFGLRTFKRVL